MKMLWVFLRPESVRPATDALRKIGVLRVTCIGVTGYGRTPPVSCDMPCAPDPETPYEILMIVLADYDVAKAVVAIRAAVKAAAKGSPENENGPAEKILVTYVDDCYMIRNARSRAGFQDYEKDRCSHTG